jgi:hypothetical protein
MDRKCKNPAESVGVFYAFVFSLFNRFVSRSRYVASNNSLIVNNLFYRLKKESVMADLRYDPGIWPGDYENHE